MICKLEKLGLKRNTIRFILAVVITVICLNMSHFNIIKIWNGPVNLDSIEVEDIKDQYIKTEIVYNLGAFYENASKKDGVKNIDKRYYVIPVGKNEYICAVFGNKDIPIANEMFEDTYAYFGGEIDKLSKSLKTEGFIYKMKGDQLASYYEWFKESEAIGTIDKNEIIKYAIPYKIILGKSEVYKAYMLTAIAGFSFMYAIYLLIRGIKRSKSDQSHKDSINNNKYTVELSKANF